MRCTGLARSFGDLAVCEFRVLTVAYKRLLRIHLGILGTCTKSAYCVGEQSDNLLRYDVVHFNGIRHFPLIHDFAILQVHPVYGIPILRVQQKHVAVLVVKHHLPVSIFNRLSYILFEA